MRPPRVGIAVPARNVVGVIETCLTSIAAQTYPAYAYIVDDASTDLTWDFLCRRPTWYRRAARNEVRQGWPIALNQAAALAFADGCDAVFTMNADDFLRLDCIEQCVKRLPGCDWVVTHAQQIGAENVVQVSKLDATLADFATYPPIVNYALIWRDVWEHLGGYAHDVTLSGSFGYKEDWDFWIRAFKAGYSRYAVVTDPTYYYVMRAGQQLHEDGLSRHEEARSLIMAKHPDVAALFVDGEL